MLVGVERELLVVRGELDCQKGESQSSQGVIRGRELPVGLEGGGACRKPEE